MTKIKATKTGIGVISQNLLAIGTGLALLGAGSAQASSFMIDDFIYSGNQTVTVNRSTLNNFQEKGSSTSILGGYRDVQILRLSNTGASPLARGIGTVLNGDLSWSNDAKFQSQLIATWDGQDNSSNINYYPSPTTAGLGVNGAGVDLTQSNTLDGILMGLTNDLPNLKVTVNIYNSSTKYSTVTTTLGANPSSGPTKQLFLPFSGFTKVGGGADFTKVQGIQLLLDGQPDMDAAVKFIEAFRGVEYVGPNNPFEDPKNSLYSAKLFEVEGRAGIQGPGDYEFAIGPSGATGEPAPIPQTNPPQGPLSGQLEQNWVNGQDVPWEISWNKATGQGSFKIGDQVISYPCVANNSPLAQNCTNSFPNINSTFSRFGIIASAQDGSGKVDPNSTIKLQVDTINDLPIDLMSSFSNSDPCSTSILVSATSLTPTPSNPSGKSLQECYFNATGPITKINGKASISWLVGNLDPTIAGRSRLDIKFKAYDPPAESLAANAPSLSVPEPNAILGLLSVSLLGGIAALKRRIL